MDASLLNLMTTYQAPAIFFGSFFFGETVILSAAFLGGQEVWSITSVFWLSLAGTIAADSLWFLFGQHLFKITSRWQTQHEKYRGFLLRLEAKTGQKPFLCLLFIKFLYGTRILTIIYLSIRKIPYGTFLLFDIIGTALWLAVMISLGFLAGKGIAEIVPLFHRVEYAFTALVALIVCFKAITTWFHKKITKKSLQ